MDHVLEHLESDHHRLLRLMYLLNRELDKLNLIECETHNCNQILDILDYIQTYPEIWHHPVEDVLFKRLLGKPNINRAAVELLLADHPRLEALGKELSGIFSELQSSEIKPSPLVMRMSRQYYSRQMSHINAERSVFSVINCVFTDEDWQEIRQEIRVLFTERSNIAVPEALSSIGETSKSTPAHNGIGIH